MRLLVVGDTHANASWLTRMLDLAVKRHCDALVQVGDFGYFPRQPWGTEFLKAASESVDDYGVPVYWLDGNHDDFDSLKDVGAYDATEMVEVGPGVTYIPRGHEWQWDGTKFLAMGGAYSIDRQYRVDGVSWWPEELVTREQVDRALDGGSIDVMFTHDAPQGIWPPPLFRPLPVEPATSMGNRKAIQAIVDARSPRLLFHGHYHHCYVSTVNGTEVRGLNCDQRIGSAAILEANHGIVYVVDTI